MPISLGILLFYFLLGLAFALIIILAMNTPDVKARRWFVLIAFSYVVWLRFVFYRTGTLDGFLYYLLPAIWILLVIHFGVIASSSGKFLPNNRNRQNAWTTQEALRGAAGTRDALRLYFSLVFIVLLLSILLQAAILPLGF